MHDHTNAIAAEEIKIVDSIQLLVAPGVEETIHAETESFVKANQETGGILIGRWFEPDTVLLMEATGAGPQANHQQYTFSIDLNYAKMELSRLRTAHFGVDYVGEWHKHPPALPRPSNGDLFMAQQMLGDPDYPNNLVNPIVVWIAEKNHIEIYYYYINKNLRSFVQLIPKKINLHYYNQLINSKSSLLTFEEQEVVESEKKEDVAPYSSDKPAFPLKPQLLAEGLILGSETHTVSVSDMGNKVWEKVHTTLNHTDTKQKQEQPDTMLPKDQSNSVSPLDQSVDEEAITSAPQLEPATVSYSQPDSDQSNTLLDPVSQNPSPKPKQATKEPSGWFAILVASLGLVAIIIAVLLLIDLNLGSQDTPTTNVAPTYTSSTYSITANIAHTAWTDSAELKAAVTESVTSAVTKATSTELKAAVTESITFTVTRVTISITPTVSPETSTPIPVTPTTKLGGSE